VTEVDPYWGRQLTSQLVQMVARDLSPAAARELDRRIPRRIPLLVLIGRVGDRGRSWFMQQVIPDKEFSPVRPGDTLAYSPNIDGSCQRMGLSEVMGVVGFGVHTTRPLMDGVPALAEGDYVFRVE
jgi:hypothetical protein